MVLDVNGGGKVKLRDTLKDIDENKLDKNSKNIIHIYENARRQNSTKTLDGVDIIF